VTPVHPRQIEIDAPSEPALDARSVVLGSLPQPPEDEAQAEKPSSPAVVWQGSVRSHSTAGRSYFIVIYEDDTARCSCLDFHFRGTLKEDRGYSCKHIRAARSRLRS
jgi:hypothetical protein